MFVVAIAVLTSWTDVMNVCALPCTASARLDAIGMFAQSSASSEDEIFRYPARQPPHCVPLDVELQNVEYRLHGVVRQSSSLRTVAENVQAH
jgi:hypothetical protein